MALLSDTVTAKSRVVPGLGLAVVLIGALTLLRLIGLKVSVVDLFFDEAQYWAWSREPAFGYFSKPPLLAWLLAAGEKLCGTSEACVRAPMPILYFGTSLLIYAAAREVYDARVAFYAALSMALATGTAFSARIASTDVPLLFFWALALLAYVKLLNGGGLRWALVLGTALGLGLLAKYAMIYFLLGIALAAILDQGARRLLLTPAPWIALGIAVILIAPNIVWNFQNGLATFRHTGDNIQGGGLEFSVTKGLEFIAAQFAVIGPILFAVLLVACARIAAPTTERGDRLMLAFAIPPLVLIAALGFVTRSLANWAAAAYISGVIVAVAVLVRRRAWGWLATSLAIGAAVQVLLLVSDPLAYRISIPGLANGDVYHRTLGWRALGERAGALARLAEAHTIVGEQRDDVASLIYYWRDQPEPVLVWPRGPVPDHHFELTRALTPAAAQPILFVSRCPQGGRFGTQFASVQRVGTVHVPTGPTSARTYYGFKLDGLRGPLRPLAACG